MKTIPEQIKEIYSPKIERYFSESGLSIPQQRVKRLEDSIDPTYYFRHAASACLEEIEKRGIYLKPSAIALLEDQKKMAELMGHASSLSDGDYNLTLDKVINFLGIER